MVYKHTKRLQKWLWVFTRQSLINLINVKQLLRVCLLKKIKQKCSTHNLFYIIYRLDSFFLIWKQKPALHRQKEHALISIFWSIRSHGALYYIHKLFQLLIGKKLIWAKLFEQTHGVCGLRINSLPAHHTQTQNSWLAWESGVRDINLGAAQSLVTLTRLKSCFAALSHHHLWVFSHTHNATKYMNKKLTNLLYVHASKYTNRFNSFSREYNIYFIYIYAQHLLGACARCATYITLAHLLFLLYQIRFRLTQNFCFSIYSKQMFCWCESPIKFDCREKSCE